MKVILSPSPMYHLNWPLDEKVYKKSLVTNHIGLCFFSLMLQTTTTIPNHRLLPNHKNLILYSLSLRFLEIIVL